MGLDIHDILKDWPYESGQVTVRRIRGQDGRDKIQLRLDLGLLQMETEGRPDGERPFGHESLLDYHLHRLEQHRASKGEDKDFGLDEQACELLRAEAMMYYHRYLAEFVLEDFEAVDRDAMRNLRLMDFCKQYAREESDRYVLEQYRPYALMMCGRARARQSLRENRPKKALAEVRNAIREVEKFYRAFGQENLLRNSGELAMLRAMVKEVESRIPADPLEKLNRQLAAAVQAERYEEAATLRDRIRDLTGKSPPSPPNRTPSSQ
ncbi:MAG TPA: hypothetical protein DCX07_16545 [Phycisphaerales bacterium]|nr:hypothetical protein [Phycisphaerales bacterium]